MPQLQITAADGMASLECEMDFVPRIGERIVLDLRGEAPRAFRVKDVEYRVLGSHVGVFLEDEPDAELLTR